MFILCVLGLVAIFPIYLFSVEHQILMEKYGPGKGVRIGEMLGKISGWGFFAFLIGLWISPQPRINLSQVVFTIGANTNSCSFSTANLVLGIPLILASCYFGIRGVRDLGLRTSETHRPERIIQTGIYEKMRHPQYLAAFLAHLGFSIGLSGLYSIYVSPLVAGYIFLISRKEESELSREFPSDYPAYKKSTNMFFSRW